LKKKVKDAPADKQGAMTARIAEIEEILKAMINGGFMGM
jgi:hypothetical protein